MIGVSDILKILDQVPIWKSLKTLPRRIEELEARVAELEATPKKSVHLIECELCGKPAKVTDIKPHPTFGFSGRKIRTITCEDGHAMEFDWKPDEK